jgi:membrane-bound metal-dependent hydrolase YbcI (DUF457 family)
MFIGHFALALGAKKVAPKLSLGTTFIAVQLLDLLWPPFLLIGIEKVKIEPGNTTFTPLNFIHYPFSHSLVNAVVWAMLFATVFYFIRKDMRNAIVVGALVLSHWFLDLLTHRPDLPVFPWSDWKVGLGLWNNVVLTLATEVGLFAAGIYFFITNSGLDKKHKIIFWSLIVFLLVVYVMNVFGPPPPSEEAISYAGFSLWLLVAWAYWADKTT